MKKSMKILAIVLIAITLVSISVSSFAVSDLVDPNTNQAKNSKIVNMGNRILGYIKVVALFIGVGAVIILGIKYMMGSIEEKAEYKKTMIPLVIGIVLVVAAVWIVDAIVGAANSMTNDIIKERESSSIVKMIG